MTTVDTRRAVPWPVRRAFPLIAVVVMILIGMAGTIWGPRLLRPAILGRPRRPVGHAGRGPAAAASGPGRPVHPADQPDHLPRRRRDPGPGRRRAGRGRAAHPRGSPGRPPDRVAGRRAPGDPSLRHSAVRRRRARRTPGREPAQALPAGRGGGDRAVERHDPLGSSGRRGGRGARAVRRPGHRRRAAQPGRLADRGRRGRAAAGAARVPGPGASPWNRGGCPASWPGRPRRRS